MTPEQEQSIEERHVPLTRHGIVICIECRNVWPCDTAIVLAALDDRTKEVEGLTDDLIDLNRQHAAALAREEER